MIRLARRCAAMQVVLSGVIAEDRKGEREAGSAAEIALDPDASALAAHQLLGFRVLLAALRNQSVVVARFHHGCPELLVLLADFSE